MKRFYTLFALLFIITMGTNAQSDLSNYEQNDSAFSQPSQVQSAKAETGTYSFRDHWTLSFKAGFNYFQLKKAQSSPDTATDGSHLGISSDMGPQFVFSTEYNFDNGFGVGAYFGSYNYNRAAVLGTSIEFGIYSHMSLLECFNWNQPLPISRRLHILFDAGLGVAGHWQINQIPGHPSSDKLIWNPYAVLRAALQVEFMVRPNWGLFVEGEYHGYGRGSQMNDNSIESSPWIHAFMANGGVRYYFDRRPQKDDPRLDNNGLPIRKAKEKTPKEAYYFNIIITPDIIEAARQNGGSVSIQSTGIDGMPQSGEIESALKVLEEQGIGTVLINSIQFDNDQLTDESMLTLDKIAGSLLANNLWTKVDLLYMSESQSVVCASLIATYLRARGIRNLSVKGYDTKSKDSASDLIITIK